MFFNAIYYEIVVNQQHATALIDARAIQLQHADTAGQNVITTPEQIGIVKKTGGEERADFSKKNSDSIDVVDEKNNKSHDEGSDNRHDMAGLSCAIHGGPSDEAAQNMVYWKDIPSDSKYVSPFFDSGKHKYMTFEPDGGGWNNIRMAMETVIVMAHAMGRTLVLPPEKRMYLLGKHRGTIDKNSSSLLMTSSIWIHYI